VAATVIGDTVPRFRVAWETARNDADTREEILIKQIRDSSVMDLKYLAIWLLASMLVGCGCAAALPFSGEAVQLTGNQTEDVVWNGSNFRGFCYNLSDGACIGTETLTIGAGALEGPDMQTWWWAVNPGGFSTGNRIWEEGMDTTYRWTARSFAGFYYDLDDGLGTETLTITGIDRSLDEGSIVYETVPRSVNFDCSRWGEYDVIGFAAENYFAGYNSDTDSDITDDTISLVSNGMLSKVLIDEDDKHMVSTGASLELEEGYELRIVKLDVSGDKAQIELLRDGKSVDTGIIANTPSTYVYTKDIGSVDDVPVIAIRVDSVFAGTEADMIVIKGVFQISENCKSVEAGDMYGKMEITSTSSSGITVKNLDDINLDEGGNTMIMGDIGFMTSDDGDRYALFVRRTVGTLNSLEIELPENPVVGEEFLIRITSEGAPVEGACVTFGGEYIGLTGSNGEVRFTPDAAGTFMVTASKRNYNSASIAVWVVGGSTATADAVIALQLAVSGEWDADADVSGDGAVTSLDALMILQMVEVPT
jgi:S-layer protein (TIGR01567 family)